MKSTYSEIIRKLELIKEKDPNYLVFGAERWAYNLREVDIFQLGGLELNHGIELPKDFKDFIVNVGFGAGPSYGVNPDLFLEVQGHDGLDEEDLDEEDDFYTPLDDGYIVVAEHGCGVETVLIIDGKHKGEIWQDHDFGVEQYAANYTEWYTKWVNVILEILENEEGEAITRITRNF